LQKEKNRIIANNINFKVIGEIQNLPQETISMIKEVEELIAIASKMIINKK
jgi:undecaprenyl pyrophosphate synthase